MRLRRRVTGALTWGLGLGALAAWSAAVFSENALADSWGTWQPRAWLSLSALALFSLVALRPSWWAGAAGHRAIVPWLLALTSPVLFFVSFGFLSAVRVTGEGSGEAGQVDGMFKVLALIWAATVAGLAWRERERLLESRWAAPRSEVGGVVAGAATAGLAVLALAALLRLPTRHEAYVASLPVLATLPVCAPLDLEASDEPAQPHLAEFYVLDSSLTLEQRRSSGGCTVDVLPEGNGGLRRRLGASWVGEQVVRLDPREGLLVMAAPSRVFAYDIARRAPVDVTLARVASQLRAPAGWVAGAGAALAAALCLQIARRRASRVLQMLSYGAQATASNGWLRFDDGRDDCVIPHGITARPGRVVVVTWSRGKADPYRGSAHASADIDVFPGSLDRLLLKASANVAALDGFTVAVASLGGAPLAAAAMIGLA